MARAGAGRPDRGTGFPARPAPRPQHKDGLESPSHQASKRGTGFPARPAPRSQHKDGLESPSHEGRGRRSPTQAVDFLYGRNAVLEALRAGRRRPYTLAIARGAKAEGTLGAILSLARQRGLPVQEVDREQLDAVAEGHQGVLLEASPYPYADLDDLLKGVGPQSLFLLLDLIEDPQNLGTLLRTADAVQVAGVVIPERRAAAVTPAVVNASAGAVEYLPVAQVTNLVQAMQTLREAGVWIAGLEALPEAQPYDKADWRGPMALVVGSEGWGMRRLVRETCDFLVRLPMAGHVTSLNAAVAGSIVLYHAWRVRSAAAGP